MSTQVQKIFGDYLICVSTLIDTSVATKQALLDAVPTGQVRIVTQRIFRKVSATLAGLSGAPTLGFNAGGTDQGTGPVITGLTGATKYVVSDPPAGAVKGAAGDVFGIIFAADHSISATMIVDVWYYDVNA